MSQSNEVIASLRWLSEAQVDEDIDPEYFIIEAKGVVEALLDGAEDEIMVGAFNTCYVDIEGALKAGLEPWQVFEKSGLLDSCMSDVVQPVSGKLADLASKLVGENPRSRNILIIDALRLLPACRGKGLGRQVIETIAAKQGFGAALLGISSVPLQIDDTWEQDTPNVDENLELDSFEGNPSEATAAVKGFLENSGFYQINDSRFMFRPLQNTVGSNPKDAVEDLLLH